MGASIKAISRLRKPASLRLWAVTIILLSVIPRALAGSESCHSSAQKFFGFQYPSSLQGIHLETPHTIQNIPAYLEAKLGSDTLKFCKDPTIKITIALGAAPETLKKIPKESLGKFVKEISNPFGAYNITLHNSSNGQKQLLFTNVNGESRYLQVLSFLKLAGVRESQISIIGKTNSYRSIYERTFVNINHTPDLVVFGFSNTALQSTAEQLAGNKNLSAILVKNKIYADQKWIKPSYDKHELSKMGVQILELENGKRIWFIDNEYGDRSTAIVEALIQHGAKNIVSFGTGGSLNPSLKIGDVIAPHMLLNAEKSLIHNPLGGLRVQRGVHAHVDSPALESKEWLAQQIAAGVDVVDVELQKIAFTKNQSATKIDAYLIISDELNSNTPSDYTGWSEFNRIQSKKTIWKLLNPYLEALTSKKNQPKITAYDIVYFATQ